ncbi:hypothetical protein [Microbacterium sp. Marseille-Q6965]|nr:hypothetical protein [Microbacterium sp. Marseille-Q6965]
MLDAATWSHVITWVIGGMSAVTAVLIVGAFYSLGRAGSRK